MRQSLVNRSVLALSGVFVGACIAFAVVVEPRSQPAPGTDPPPAAAAPMADIGVGEKLYAMRCARCHDLDESLAPLREAEPGTDARAAYLAMLQRHRKSPVEENAAITDYLESRLGDAASPSPASR